MSEVFHRRAGELFCENVPLARVVAEFGTPCYVYSSREICDRFDSLRSALASVEHTICFSVKSNASGALLRLLASRGAGADIVSGGELFRALRAGIKPERIVFAGVGKSQDEIRSALSTNILMFNVESRPELEAISHIASEMGVRARIALRVNPDIDAHTHSKTTTGTKETKFGIPLSDVADVFRWAASMESLEPIGIDVHLGSPIVSLEPYRQALRMLANIIIALRERGIALRILDMGGGFAITYNNERPFMPQEFAAAVIPVIKELGVRLIIEPGRFIVGAAGILLTRLLYVKESSGKIFYICDAGMNDLIRPAFYGSYHPIVPLRLPPGQQLCTADVVGPICETSDLFAQNRTIERVEAGEVLAILCAGAYGFSMASTYNSRPRPCEVLVDGESYRLIRRRETYEDLVRLEE